MYSESNIRVRVYYCFNHNGIILNSMEYIPTREHLNIILGLSVRQWRIKY